MDGDAERGAEVVSPDELAAQDAAELPRREAMSLIDTGSLGGMPLTGAEAPTPDADTVTGGDTGAPADGATAPEAGTTANPLAGSPLANKLLTNPFVG